jgi:hypothetical protein
MGAGASFERKVYKRIVCGCIYCYCFNEERIQLLCPCYICIDNIKNKKYNTIIAKTLSKEIKGKSEDEIIMEKNGWISEALAIQQAHNRGMRCIEEFINNHDILEKNNIYY